MKSRLFVTTVLAAACVMASNPAFAIIVAGGIDPATGMKTLLPWALSLVGLGICGVGIWKGAHAAHDGRSLGPAIAGVIGGSALSFGTAYVLTNYGVQ